MKQLVHTHADRTPLAGGMLVTATLSVGLVACSGPIHDSSEPPAQHQLADAEQALTIERKDGYTSYRVSTPRGRIVRYVLSDDGAPAVFDGMPRDVVEELAPVVQATGTDPVLVWEAAYPDREVPPELVDLQIQLDHSERPQADEIDDRPVDERVEVGGSRDQAPNGDLVPKHATNSGSHFRFDHRGCFHGGGDVYWSCWRNTTDGYRWAQAKSRWAIYRFASLSAPMTMYIAYGDRGFSESFAPGFIGAYIVRGTNHRTPRRRVQRIDVVGDHFHLGTRFHDHEWRDPQCAAINGLGPVGGQGLCASGFIMDEDTTHYNGIL